MPHHRHQQHALMANVNKNLIQGAEIMTRFSFLLDLMKSTITISREEDVLQHGEDTAAQVVFPTKK